LQDAEAKLVITADGGFRKDKVIPLKTAVDQALADNAVPSVENVLVVQRTKADITMVDGRDHWWHELQAKASADCPATEMDAEDVLFILYTSGTTGKPKGLFTPLAATTSTPT
jgi:acetyl-CoA synthetase